VVRSFLLATKLLRPKEAMGVILMHEFEVRATEVSRRILPDEPANSRLFCDLRALTVGLLREIDRRQKNTESKKRDTDWPAISYASAVGS